MKISESDKRQLRDAQQAETSLGKLRADLAALKNNPELSQLEADRSATRSLLQQQNGQLDLLNLELKRLESDLEVVTKRIQRDEELLPTMANAKDIAGLEHELATLKERLDALETQELEVLEQIDSITEGIANLETQLSAQQTAISEQEQRRVSGSAELVSQIAEQEEHLKQALGALPAELSNLAQQLWSRGSGVGELHDTTCGVCHMGLNSSAITEIKRTPLDELVQCPECRAILIFGGGA